MATAPAHVTNWTDGSARPTNLKDAVNSLALDMNTLFPLGIGAWTTYTPALTATTTNPTLGTTGKIATGRYFRIGKLIMAQFRIQFASIVGEINKGSGAYRISLPVPCTSFANTNGIVVGYGHIFDASEGGGLGLGPGSFRDVMYHNATSITTSVAGIVIGSNQPILTNAMSAFTPTNVTTDRDYDANTAGNAAARIDEIADVLGTVIADLVVSQKQYILDNTADSVPWVWTINDALIGTLIYEAA